MGAKIKRRYLYNMDPRISNAIEFINAHMATKITLMQLSRIMCLSYGYCSVFFKREIGCCLCKYLKKLRIRRARNLLKNASIQIKDVAYSVGYRDAANFSHDFKRIAGLSPANYRKEHYTSRAK